MNRKLLGSPPSPGRFARGILAIVAIMAPRAIAAVSPTGNVLPPYPVTNPDPWVVGDELRVGDSANGSLSINAGSDVLSEGGTAGFDPLTVGSITVTGLGSTWTNNLDLLLGAYGTGTLDVLSAAHVENQNAFLGQVSLGPETGVGQAVVRGAGSQWLNAQNLVVGYSGKGELTIEQQGFVHSNSARIGLNQSAMGTVVVDGQKSTWEIADLLSVGNAGNAAKGSLSLTGAGSRVYVGAAATIQGATLPIGQTAIIVSASSGAAQLAIYGGNTVMNSGTAYLGVGASESGAALVQGTGSTWNNGDSVFVGLSGAGTLTLADGGTVSTGGLIAVAANGLVTGNGTVVGTVMNSGSVAPGQSIGSLTVNGNFIQSGAGKLQVELAGTSAGEFDTLASSAQAVLAGQLEVALGMNGGHPFAPQLGDTFQFLTAGGGVNGKFASANLPTLAAGKMWHIRYAATGATLAITVAGDYNDDGVVDVADYTVWRDLSGAIFDPRADGDTNGVVDAADYNVWKTNFGLTAGAGAAGLVTAAGIPEPPTILLAAAMLAVPLANVQLRRR